jgi:glycosyltransferase involved in cell wall biosynthesis
MPFPRLWTHLRLSVELALHPPDLLLVPAHVLPLLHPRRSVVTVHDLGYLHEPQAHRRLDRLYLDLSNRYHVCAATRLLAISQATKDDLVRRYGVAPERVIVTHLAAGADMRPVDDPARVVAVKSRCGIAGDYLLYVGTLQPRKNLARLVQAFALVSAQHPTLQLVLAGKKGWMYEEIFAQVRRMGLERRVVFTGYVDGEELPALYSGALAFVFPSLYEGFGMPVLEAMACGAPVVAANTSSLPEVAGDAALLVDPTDVAALSAALSRLAGDPALRSDLRARGLVQAVRFSWERCARETLAAMEEAMTAP